LTGECVCAHLGAHVAIANVGFDGALVLGHFTGDNSRDVSAMPETVLKRLLVFLLQYCKIAMAISPNPSAGLCESRARRRYRSRAAYLAPAMSQTILGNPRELFVVDDDVVPFGALPALA
jgi:hypothetical protein